MRPNDAFAMAQLSWVYLALGRPADALQRAEQQPRPCRWREMHLARRHWPSAWRRSRRMPVEPDEAIKTLRDMLSIPTGIAISVNRLKLDPVWDPIRSHPEFAELIAGTEYVGALPGYGQ